MKKHNKFLRSLLAIVIAILMVGSVVPTVAFAGDNEVIIEEESALEGILSSFNEFINTVKEFFNKIIEFFRSLFGIEPEQPEIPEEPTDPEDPAPEEPEVGGTRVENSEELLGALAEGGTAVLGADITLDEVLNVESATTKLDLGENTLTGSIEVSAGATLTVDNGSIDNDDTNVSGIQNNGGTLVLNDVNISSARHAVRVEGGTVTINGGEYKVDPKNGNTLHAVNVSDGGIVIINDGTFVGPKGTMADSGAAVNVQSGSTVIIHGGNFSGGKNNTLASKGTLIVYGGTFDQDPSAYVAEGYKAVYLDGAYTILKKEADVVVDSKDELAAALKSGGTVILSDNIDLDKGLTIPAGVTVTLDLNGKALNGNSAKDAGALIVNEGDLTIVGDANSIVKNTAVNGDAVIRNTGKLTLNGGQYIGSSLAEGSYPAYVIYSSGDITVEAGTVVTSDRGAIEVESGNAVINGGSFTTTDAANTRILTLHTITAHVGSTLTIYDGDFENKFNSTSGSSIICPWGGSISIYGGNFSYAVSPGGQTGIFQNYMGYGMPVNVYGGTYDDNTVLKNLAAGYEAFVNGDGIYTVYDINGKTKIADGYYSDATGANYYVYNAAGLANMRTWMSQNYNNTMWNKTYNIMADIDATGVTWTTMIMTPDSSGFNGIIFEGNGHTIKNLKIESAGGRGGLFTGACNGSSDIATPAIFRNVTFDNATVEGGSHHIGLVWGEVVGDIVLENVHVINSIVSGGCNVGGLIGRNSESHANIKFVDCSVKDTIVWAKQKADNAGASAFLGNALHIGTSCSANVVFEGDNAAEGNTLKTDTGMQGGGIYTTAEWDAPTWDTPTVVYDFTNYNSAE